MGLTPSSSFHLPSVERGAVAIPTPEQRWDEQATKYGTIGATALALAGGSTAIAVAGSGDDDTGDSEAPITGSALEQAEAAALEHLGEGTVSDTEVGDEESYYEVEVTLDDGSETDVQLNRDFDVVGEEPESGSEANDDD